MNLKRPLAIVSALALVVIASLGLTPALKAARPQPGAVASRFESLDVLVDSGEKGLAAYQIEVTSSAPQGTIARIVGIEGGDKAPFTQPPFYDPAALQGGRVILAAYTLNAEIPSGRFRVARVHMLVTGPAPSDDEPRQDPAYTVKVMTAAAPDASAIPLSASTTVGGRK